MTGKVDDPPFAPRLKIYTQDRDDFTQASTAAFVTTTAPADEWSIPHLTRDSDLPAQHLSFTVQAASDNVMTKVKDGSTWAASTLRAVSTTADTEDHAQVDFTYSGRRFTVFHRDQAGANDPDIFLEITTWDGTTWTEVAEFGLTDSETLDFPSIWIDNAGGTTTEVAVVARNPAGLLAIWKCGPAAEASCDSAGELGSPLAVTTSGVAHSPEVLVVPRSGTSDTFVFIENHTGTDRIQILSLCGGTGTLTNQGTIPYPSGGFSDQQLGGEQAWSRSQVTGVIDGEFSLAFLLRSTATGSRGIARYHAAPGDLCP